MEIEKDSAQVNTPPPLIFLLLVILGLVLRYYFPINLITGSVRWALFGLFFCGSVILLYSSFMLFKKLETNIEPWRSTSSIIMEGPYRFSRNPIYLAGVLLLMSIGLALNDLWTIFLIIPFVLVIHFKVIVKEEHYLAGKFGEEYLNYKCKVRRWA